MKEKEMIDAFRLITILEKRIDEATNEDFIDGLLEAILEIDFLRREGERWE